jgi:hypothetical protein
MRGVNAYPTLGYWLDSPKLWGNTLILYSVFHARLVTGAMPCLPWT